MIVKFIEPRDTLEIRHYVLRPNQPFSACIYPGDDKPTTFHLGGFINDELICITSVYEEKSKLFTQAKQFRMRGMATLIAHHHKGYAKELLLRVEDEIIKKQAELLWFNARKSAFPFYKKLGYTHLGEMFEIEGTGEHKIMYKEFNN